MRIAIVSAVRTPIGNFGGSLKTILAQDLGALVLNEAVKRARLSPDQIEAVILGQNYQSGEYVNIARMSLLTSGWPVAVPGLSIDRRCPSGFDAVCLGAMMVETGNAKIVVAGGVESMSTAEFYVKGDVRWGIGGTGNMPNGHGDQATWSLPLYDRIQRARVMSQPEARFGILQSMMTWAETAAAEHKLTRAEIDEWALQSNQKACAAIQSGRFTQETVPVPVPQRKGEPVPFSQDERPRADSTLETLAKLKPVLGGVCTAGNSSGENDGASVCVLMSEDTARDLKLKPVAYLKSFALSGADPRQAWKALTVAVNNGLKKAGLSLGQIDLIELHEAFAAQTLANMRELGLTREDYPRINVNGSCVALGHPLGATGTRILTTLVYEMQRREAKYGLIGICGGGGMGVSGIIERA